VLPSSGIWVGWWVIFFFQIIKNPFENVQLRVNLNRSGVWEAKHLYTAILVPVSLQAEI